MRPDEGLFPRVVEVVPHEEVQQLGGLGPDGAQLGVTALQRLVAQSGAHVGPPFIEGGGELDGHEKAQGPRQGPRSSPLGEGRVVTLPDETTHLIN